jgi:hypothetical protein
MSKTLEEILAQKEESLGGESVEDILARAKKVTYPFDQPGEIRETGFRYVAPGKIEYGEQRPDASLGEAARGYTELVSNIILPVAGMEFGGGLIPKALVKARPVIGGMIKAGARALGAGAGEEAARAVGGEKPSLRRGLRTARNVGLIEGTIRGAGYMTARAGSVEPAAAALAQDDPSLLRRVPASEYAAAAKDIAKTRIPATAEHAAYMQLVKARGNVDGTVYVDRILNKLRANVDEPTARFIETKTFNLADKLSQRLGPNGEISAESLDDWIRINVSEPAARVYERGAGTAWQERLATLREDLTPKLYQDVGGGAAELQRAASTKIGKGRAAETMFPEQTAARPNLQSPTYLRQVLKDNDLGYQVRERLNGLDEVAGTNHLERVENLAMRSSWTAAEKAEVEDILANVPAIAYERVGLVRAGSRKVGRGLTRIARPTGRITAVGSTIRGVSQ